MPTFTCEHKQTLTQAAAAQQLECVATAASPLPSASPQTALPRRSAIAKAMAAIFRVQMATSGQPVDDRESAEPAPQS